jgi:hypothetical protein
LAWTGAVIASAATVAIRIVLVIEILCLFGFRSTLEKID